MNAPTSIGAVPGLLVKALAITAAGLPLFAALALLAGRVLTDRTLITQFLFWIPALWAAGAVSVLALLVYATLSLFRRVRAMRSIRVMRLTTLLLLTGGWGWLLLVERSPFASAPGAPSGSPRFRIAHWNAESPKHWASPDFLAPVLQPFQPDAVLFAVAMTQDHFVNICRGLPQGFFAQRRAQYAAASRFPIANVRYFSMNLSHESTAVRTNNDPTWLAPSPTPLHAIVEHIYNLFAPRFGVAQRYFRASDPGHLLLIELDTKDRIGRNLVIWYIDLPSDPLGSKWELATRVLAFFDNARASTDDDGNSVLPKADLFIGDFNIPRGSASLSRITEGFTPAFDQSGHWSAASWPREHPLFHLDQAFTGPALRVLDYRLIDPGSSEHRAQLLDIEMVP